VVVWNDINDDIKKDLEVAAAIALTKLGLLAQPIRRWTEEEEGDRWVGHFQTIRREKAVEPFGEIDVAVEPFGVLKKGRAGIRFSIGRDVPL
jgi:hypothetical protein